MKKQATILLLTIITAVILCGAASAATTYNVGPNPTDDFPTITQAVNAATDGDTIQVNPNNGNPYVESVNVDHNLNIQANGQVTVQNQQNWAYAFNLGIDGSTVKGFTITDNPNDLNIQAGISISADNCKILNNNINGFVDGIVINTGNNNVISGNTITSVPNQVGYSYGIDVSQSSNNKINYNTIISQGSGTGSSIGIALYSDTTTGNQIIGNNIMASHTSGTGANYGILVRGNDNTAHFNRIIASTKAIMYFNNPQVSMDAKYNWYGSNDNPQSKIEGVNIIYSPWLIMIVSANPTTIYTGGTSTVTADFTHDSTYDPNNPAASYHDSALGHFPDNVGVLITSTGGSVGSDSTTAYTINGVAATNFRADQGPGKGTAAGSLDSQTPLSVNINILQSPADLNSNQANAVTTVNAATKTTRMQNTGVPLIGLLLAFLLLFAGFMVPKRN